ncbi:Heat shock protein HslJ [Cnuella takakiae]|uniref:Heat shock protein HslJ n=1 Tax=Cnuella takakiae TaxID=1302690 RepID=A0A1M4WY41_9BACT|nr:META domain-containing protein [Cnuella takakiae]OLY91593.1 hypothetical protein BUE76_06520 [Cnuella takakiae]SHE85882.1 Heat shock protein HslJ [Cnuella takakiae]
MKFAYFLIALLLLVGRTTLQAQTLLPGFSKAEYTELMRVSARTTFDTVYANKHPAPERFRMVYRSPVSGLDNLWDLWADGQGTAAISIRGTTKKQESWLENFYAAMVPAKGSLVLPGNTHFSYQLAPQQGAAVHMGWLIGMASMAGDMRSKIDSAYRAGTRNLLIVGHSQGGAIAYLLTAYLLQLQQLRQLPAYLRVKTYCSAAPKPGNTQFAYAYEAMTFGGWAFNVVNSADWVPESPFTIQTISDFNKQNPFGGAKDAIRKVKFPQRLALMHVYNRLDKTTRKADKTYRKYLGRMIGKQVAKLMPGLDVPDYVASNNYARAGTPVVLLADSAYFAQYSDTSANIWIHHLHAPYLLLLDRLAPNATAMQSIPDGSWELSFLAGSPQPIAELYPGRKPSLQFDAANARVGGSTGCNRFSGGVTLGEKSIHFAAMALTKMYCPGEGEKRFLDALQQANAFALTDSGELTLLRDQEPLMRLQKR